MNIEEYQRSGRERYAKLAEIVASLLEHEIADDPGYQLQQIQQRAKTVESLSQRLEEMGKLESDEIEAHRKDLAGCRVIFYTNNDVTKFVNSALLGELFDVDWDRSKFHHPGPDDMSVDHLFQSYNFVLKLKSDRTSLREYHDFQDLYCEVQIQTILNHAWAEMAHDTIYKQTDLQGFGTRALETIKERLEDVMRKHLLPAGYLFQRIATDVQRISDGKALFDAGVLEMVLTAKNNNERHDALVQLKEIVLPHYDDLPNAFTEIRDKLKEAWVLSGNTKSVPHSTPFGNYKGRESHEVTDQISKILEQYLYIEPYETYTFVRDLFVETSNMESRKQLVNLAERLGSNEIHIWERYGPSIQVMLAEVLSKEQDIASMAEVATAIARKILEPDIRWTTPSSNAVTFHQRAIWHSDAIEEARRSIIRTILSYAESVANSDDALADAIGSLFEAGRRPQYGNMCPDLATMIFSDLAFAVRRMIKISTEASVNARQNIESELLQCWRRNKSIPEHLCEVRKVVEAHEQLVKSMTSLRDILNADEEFVIFKTIVGYKSVFPHQWEETHLDFDQDQAVRHQRQDELVASITAENWSTWKSRLSTAAKVKSRDLATFPPYERFLSAIATEQPRLAFELLEDRSTLPNWTICPITCVLLGGKLRDDVEALLEQWLEEGGVIREVADVATSARDVSLTFVSKIAVQAVREADTEACTRLATAAIRRHAENPQFWRDEVFLPCISVLQRAEAHEWIGRSWHKPGEESLFRSLTLDQCRTVLEAMVSIRHIDHPAEQILKSIAMTDHGIVLNWFGQRIQHGVRRPESQLTSIPFSFESLHEELQPHPQDIMLVLREWFDRDIDEGRWHVWHFLSRVYPNFEEPLPGTLLKSADDANSDDLMFIASALRGFEGRSELFPILRAILASDAATDDIEDLVAILVHETGVMTGEFGASEAYKTKIEQLNPWVNDKSKRVSAFAVREIKNFEQIIAVGNRRAQERIAMRKLDYDEALVDSDSASNDGTANDVDSA